MTTTPSKSDRLAELFARAIERDATTLEEWLGEACAGDAELERELRELLAADAVGFRALDGGLEGLGAAERAPRVEGFEVESLLGAGAMGTVWAAHQQHPDRRVALKLLGAYYTRTPALERRFEHEARLLARLDHEGIARIYQAGFATEPARTPYFAMELVDGLPLLEHVGRAERTVPERVELLALVAEAVQHAHFKGILHRDLKPSNILVDRGGRPKILDFGVARDLERRADGTLMTSAGQVVGTLGYMSPEQAAGEEDVDTRADVYALGVMLYEVLSGQAPHRLRGKKLTEAVRMLQEEDPPPLRSVAAALPSDLETIVHKCLRKEPAARYATAGELAADLRRFLRNEPIAARPASALYTLRKFARRRRALVTGLVGAALALVVGSLVAVGFAFEARRAAEAAERERLRAEGSAAEADRERARATDEAETARRFVNFVLETLGEIDILKARGEEPTLRQAMDGIAANLEEKLAEEPYYQARLYGFLGNMYRALGDPEVAEPLLVRSVELFDALGVQRGHAVDALLALAYLRAKQGRGAESEALAERGAAMALAAEGEESLRYANALLALYDACYQQERFEEALGAIDRSLAIRRRLFAGDDEEVAVALVPAAQARFDLGRLEEGKELAAEALAMRRRMYGSEHPLLPEALQTYGNYFWFRRDYARCEELLREALAIREKTLPPNHPVLHTGYASLGALLHQREDFEGAYAAFVRANEVLVENYGEAHPLVADLKISMGRELSFLDRNEEAEEVLREAIAARARRLPNGIDDVELCHDYELLGAALLFQERWEEAEAVLRKSLEMAEEFDTGSGALSLRILEKFGYVLDQLGRDAEAQAVGERMEALRAKIESKAGGG